jgi:radical SAM protein with 4Fe4S-binding SPASM domain
MKRFQTFDEVKNSDLLNSTLKSIELNITTSCNRSCSFCPHSWGFKKDKRQKHVSLETVDNFIASIFKDDYKNQITLCGMGEPTMHPEIKEILHRVQSLDNKVILVTNSYKLSEIVEDLGKVHVRVSLYEPTELPKIENIKVLDYYSDGPNEYFNGRGSNQGIEKSCYFPSYKMSVDTTGGILPCDNNWESLDYLGNINEDNIKTIWFEKLHSFRKNCNTNRLLNDFCKNCDADGTLYGKKESDLLTSQLG